MSLHLRGNHFLWKHQSKTKDGRVRCAVAGLAVWLITVVWVSHPLGDRETHAETEIERERGREKKTQTVLTRGG